MIETSGDVIKFTLPEESEHINNNHGALHYFKEFAPRTLRTHIIAPAERFAGVNEKIEALSVTDLATYDFSIPEVEKPEIKAPIRGNNKKRYSNS